MYSNIPCWIYEPQDSIFEKTYFNLEKGEQDILISPKGLIINNPETGEGDHKVLTTKFYYRNNQQG